MEEENDLSGRREKIVNKGDWETNNKEESSKILSAVEEEREETKKRLNKGKEMIRRGEKEKETLDI